MTSLGPLIALWTHDHAAASGSCSHVRCPKFLIELPGMRWDGSWKWFPLTPILSLQTNLQVKSMSWKTEPHNRGREIPKLEHQTVGLSCLIWGSWSDAAVLETKLFFLLPWHWMGQLDSSFFSWMERKFMSTSVDLIVFVVLLLWSSNFTGASVLAEECRESW